jgi:colicin import membrane protein
MMRPRRGGQGSWTLSILLHLAIAGLVAGLWYWAAHKPKPPQLLGIEARVVSGDALDAPAIPAPAPVPEETPLPEVPVEEPPPETPPVDPGPTPEQVAASKAAEEARVAEERRVAVEKQEAERKLAAENADRDRKAKEKADRDKAEKEKAEKDKAERDRLAREKAERDRLEQARKAREDELSAQLAAEERRNAARNSSLMAQYAGMIANRIDRNWLRPPSAKPGIECVITVTQTPGGTVTAAKVGRCNGDETVRQSIEAAVLRASPLPLPSDPALFERELVITFRPD